MCVIIIMFPFIIDIFEGRIFGLKDWKFDFWNVTRFWNERSIDNMLFTTDGYCFENLDRILRKSR